MDVEGMSRANETPPDSDAPNETLRRKLDGLIDRYKTESADLERKLEAARAKSQADGEELRKAKQIIQTLQARSSEFEAQQRRVAEENKQILADFEKKAVALEGRLRQKEAELAASRALLSSHNENSEAEVAEELERLNNLIETFATDNAIRWVDSFTGAKPKHLEKSADDTLVTILGLPLHRALEKAKPAAEIAPLLLQIAWQTVMVQAIHRIFKQFSYYCPARAKESAESLDNHFYGFLNMDIRLQESQVVYGHWRSLTHRHLRATFPSDELDGRVRNYSEACSARCQWAAILLLEQQSRSQEDLAIAMRPALHDILDSGLRLATMIRENIITRNYHLYQPSVANPFDKNTMDVDAGEKADVPSDLVACTTRLGLVYSSKIGGESTRTPQLFVKARVLTRSTLDDLIAQST